MSEQSPDLIQQVEASFRLIQDLVWLAGLFVFIFTLSFLVDPRRTLQSTHKLIRGDYSGR